jgi:hypothetical protein
VAESSFILDAPRNSTRSHHGQATPNVTQHLFVYDKLSREWQAHALGSTCETLFWAHSLEACRSL